MKYEWYKRDTHKDLITLLRMHLSIPATFDCQAILAQIVFLLVLFIPSVFILFF
jgi:hypothetical protein